MQIFHQHNILITEQQIGDINPPLRNRKYNRHPPVQPITSPSLRSIRRTPNQLHSLQQIPTQHDMLPQHLVYVNELNCEYVIILARNNETP